ncbi:hypothetical protein [Natrinema hispanicum]|uniref:Phage PhiH1 repressor protein n=2 Tax=Natrinema TaxID=88723 RepID=M0CIC0_9EURY|nr:hypothetical protein [Natrinema hispanicum]ELZ21634.1 phage PhiH1 repressor protein [Natrinema limicola JCM 13563]
MHLTEPTDFDLLEILTEGRNLLANIASRLEKSQGYISSQLPKLADQHLVNRIGLAERAGLYEITARGEAVLACRDQYADGEGGDIDPPWRDGDGDYGTDWTPRKNGPTVTVGGTLS